MGTASLQVEVSVQDCFEAEVSGQSLVTAYTATPAETWQSWFEQWLEILHEELPPERAIELSLRLTGDAEIQALNAQYRQQNKPTDVLAFAALEVHYPQPAEELDEEPVCLGDIAISVETACRQALDRGHSLQTELAWLAAHGLLHLLGWDHPDSDSLTRMLNQQATLLHAVGLLTEKEIEMQS
jgi:probable rRNA maturation factor